MTHSELMQAIRRRIMVETAGVIYWKDDAGKNHSAEFAEIAKNDTYAAAQGFTHEIWFDNVATARYAKVLKTVIHVCTDEDADGKPVFTKWKCETLFFKR